MTGMLLSALFALTAAVALLAIADSAVRARKAWAQLRREAADFAVRGNTAPVMAMPRSRRGTLPRARVIVSQRPALRAAA